jgi:predicted DCC family thiol-disulfide oxidoreductase YuxK
MTSDASILKRVDRGMFAPQTPTYLGVCRMLMFAWLFVWYFITDFAYLAQYPAAMWEPVPLLSLLGLADQPSMTLVTTLKTLWLCSLFLSCVGLFTRTSIATSFALGLYLLAASHSFHKINHSDAGLLMAMFVLMLSRCGDGFSIDSLRHAAMRGAKPILPSGEYRWPVQTVRIIWVLVFFLAGVSKLRIGGLDWMFSDSMSNLVMRKQYSWEPPTSVAWFFLDHPWTLKAMSTGATMIELLAPLSLFTKWGRALVVPGMLIMQVSIRLMMGDDFSQFMSIYLFFVPWLVIGSFSLRFAPKGVVDVLYDGKCGLCGRTVSVLKRLDLFGRLRFRDIVSEWPEIQADHPSISSEAAFKDMHAIDALGRVARGFDSYRLVAWSLPLGWVLLPLLYFPGVRFVGQKVYRKVADQRVVGGQCAI